MVMMLTMDYMEEKMKKPTLSYEDYLLALEEERRKIQVFHRELPLCLDLVNQAIENCKQHVCSAERSECEDQQQATSSEGPVLEEFIPLKRTSSREEKENNNNNKCNENIEIEKKVDWLRSVQLWNQNPGSPSQQQDKSNRIKENANGGAFHPFHEKKPIKSTTEKAETAATGTKTGTTITKNAPSPVPTTSTSSTADNSFRRKEEKESQLNRKSRRCWSPELHRRFLQALQQLGGSHAATPKQIRELMKVDGLTNDEVKSHLQKYRLHTRRPGPSMHNNSNAQPTQFVVVGGIWVPPQDYTAAAAAAAAASKGDATSTSPDRIYAPVAAPPELTLSSRQLQRKRNQLSPGSSHSEQKSSRADHSMGDENAHSGSLTAASSSTDTTTASPNL